MSDLAKEAANFGNYSLQGMDTIVLPAPIAWWPQTLAWKILALLLLVWALRTLYRRYRQYQRNRYRRDLLRQLDELAAQPNWRCALLSLPGLLKATALAAYSRELVAELSGQRWLDFLNAQTPEALFAGDSGQQLLQVAYQPPASWGLAEAEGRRLLASVRQWIVQHREALVDV